MIWKCIFLVQISLSILHQKWSCNYELILSVRTALDSLLVQAFLGVQTHFPRKIACHGVRSCHRRCWGVEWVIVFNRPGDVVRDLLTYEEDIVTEYYVSSGVWQMNRIHNNFTLVAVYCNTVLRHFVFCIPVSSSNSSFCLLVVFLLQSSVMTHTADKASESPKITQSDESFFLQITKNVECHTNKLRQQTALSATQKMKNDNVWFLHPLRSLIASFVDSALFVGILLQTMLWLPSLLPTAQPSTTYSASYIMYVHM